MKKSILIFTGIISLFLIVLLSFSGRAEFKLGEKRYFLESGDSVICEISGFDRKIKVNGVVSMRTKISNDSIYLEGETSYDKYGESKEGPNKFITVFNEDGVLDTSQLRRFINTKKDLFRPGLDTMPTITKITIK